MYDRKIVEMGRSSKTQRKVLPIIGESVLSLSENTFGSLRQGWKFFFGGLLDLS